MKNNNKLGFSIVEILVVVGVFSVISIVITQSLLSSLKNTRKTDNQINVRENLNYIISVMERRLRNANDIDLVTSTPQLINYLNEAGDNAFFLCSNLTGSGEIADEVNQISSNQIDIESCNFIYTDSSPGVPKQIKITISAKAKDTVASEESISTVSTIINLRVY